MDVGNQYGYQCPNCGRGTDLLVAASVGILLTPNGTDIDATTTPEWSQTSAVDCLNCGWCGTVEDLATVGIKKPPAPERVDEAVRKKITDLRDSN